MWTLFIIVIAIAVLIFLARIAQDGQNRQSNKQELPEEKIQKELRRRQSRGFELANQAELIVKRLGSYAGNGQNMYLDQEFRMLLMSWDDGTPSRVAVAFGGQEVLSRSDNKCHCYIPGEWEQQFSTLIAKAEVLQQAMDKRIREEAAAKVLAERKRFGL